MPRLRKFNRDLNILNTVLTDLIARAKGSESKADLEDLQARNYDKVCRDEIVYTSPLVPLSAECGIGVVVLFSTLPPATLVGLRFGRASEILEYLFVYFCFDGREGRICLGARFWS